MSNRMHFFLLDFLWTFSIHTRADSKFVNQISETIGTTLIKHRPNTFASDRYLIDVDPRVFAIWKGILSNDPYRCGIPYLKNENSVISLKYQCHDQNHNTENAYYIQSQIREEHRYLYAQVMRQQFLKPVQKRYYVSESIFKIIRKDLFKIKCNIYIHSIICDVNIHQSHMHNIRDPFHQHGLTFTNTNQL